jgi:hypothetical protein
MKKNHIWKSAIGILLLAIAFRFGIGWIIDLESPEIIEQTLERLKKDTTIIKRIGGYESYKYNFNHTNFEKGAPFDFTLKVYGSDSVIIFNGIALKKSNKWIINKIDTVYKSY